MPDDVFRGLNRHQQTQRLHVVDVRFVMRKAAEVVAPAEQAHAAIVVRQRS